MQQSRSDFVWYLTTRFAAIAMVVAAIAIFVSTKEHESISSAQATAVHRADLASKLKKTTSSARGALVTATSTQN